MDRPHSYPKQNAAEYRGESG